MADVRIAALQEVSNFASPEELLPAFQVSEVVSLFEAACHGITVRKGACGQGEYLLWLGGQLSDGPWSVFLPIAAAHSSRRLTLLKSTAI